MCTNFKMKQAADGTVVVGRTMEFPAGMPWVIGVLPIGYEGVSAVKGGKTWTAKYGAVGMGVGKAEWLDDGMNTAGLSIHGLYMPGHCTYAKATGTDADITQLDLGAYLLGTCATVNDVRAALDGLNVIGLDPGMGLVPPVHLFVHDATSSIAIEFPPEGMSIVDNPSGVGTNAPFLDWHLTNLDTYAGISGFSPAPVTENGMTIAPFGQGAGLRGLPGDLTPPSRFVRAFAYVALSEQPQTTRDAEMSALHILNNFDIPVGLVREAGPNGTTSDEVTDWLTISNLTQGRYSYRTFDDPTVYVIDLKATDFSSTRVVQLPSMGEFTPQTI